MATKPQDKNLLPALVPQNPAPFNQDSQGRKDAIRSQVDRIMEAFFKLLPSNYASQVMGPFYSIQFQAAAERIAEFQITAQESMVDSMYDFTRSEVLYQILGSLVFPDAVEMGYPDLEGDLTYRTFLQNMVKLLLQGATAATMKDGIELLTDASVEIIERGVQARKLKGKSAWGNADMFTFEVNMSKQVTVTVDGSPVVLYTFPDNAFTLQRNVQLVLRALKPAHTLYEYRNLFKETFGDIFSETSASFDFTDYHYQDYRRYWLGAEKITGSSGETLTDRSLFSDPSRDFSNINYGAGLTILTGPNSTALGGDGYVGHYQVLELLGFPIPNDPTPRSYVSGVLTGKAVVSEGFIVEDVSNPLVDWSSATEGQTLEFLEGPNMGVYRLKTVMGQNGGPVGSPMVTGPANKVRISSSLLRVRPRMKAAATGQAYQVTVDRLGVQNTNFVVAEDASMEFVQSGNAVVTRDYNLTEKGPLVKAGHDPGH